MATKIKIILFGFILSSISLFAQPSYDLFDGTNGTGTAFDPYTIYYIEHIEQLADSVNESAPGTNNWSKDKYFTLMNDIPDTLRRPIGVGFRSSNAALGYSFQGVFDGQNHKIIIAMNNYLAVVNGDQLPSMFIGLFSMTYKAKISNLVVDGYIITAPYVLGWHSSGVGSIVGHAFDSSEFYNCTSYVDIISDYGWIGGIIGFLEYCNYGKIENCVNYGNIETTAGSNGGIAGGISGTSTTVAVLNCINFGNIIALSSLGSTGGIIGYSEGPLNTITNCINFGNITGSATSAGIVASVLPTQVSNCINVGKITGNIRAAGIVGSIGRGTIIKNCINIGDVAGDIDVGGIVGMQPTWDDIHPLFPTLPLVIDCINSGYIRGNNNVGGIMGFIGNNVTITNCINTGVIEGNNNAGAIAGTE
jgi:hypothetical protein